MSNRSEFILVRKGIISIAVKKDLGGLLSVSISFTVGAGRSFEESLPSDRSCVFLSPSIHPSLPLHTRPSRSVVTARRLYKFYIIFMRHKVVEKPTEERREKKRVRIARESDVGEVFSVQIIPLGLPYHPRQSEL